jgi:hypothetical protein
MACFLSTLFAIPFYAKANVRYLHAQLLLQLGTHGVYVRTLKFDHALTVETSKMIVLRHIEWFVILTGMLTGEKTMFD